MIHSVITLNTLYFNTLEMLIPKIIGDVREGYCRVRRIDRMLPVGHRRRGYEE